MSRPKASEVQGAPAVPIEDLIAGNSRRLHGIRGSDLTAAGIAATIGQLVSRGEIAPGDKLPTVRSLAKVLRVSPSTISDTWRILQAHSIISTDRRRGTIVRSTKGHVDGRYWHVPVEPGTLDRDLSTGTPDASLLPPLGPALSKTQLDLPVTSYLDHPVVPELEALIRERWPFIPQTVTIVDGAQDALDRVVTSLINLGDAVIVEDPTFPPIIDMMELAGARVIGVPLDSEGMQLDRLGAALAEDPVALFLQPRSHNPTSVTMSEDRARRIAELLAPTSITVVEDDHSGPIAGTNLHSIGEHLPNQTVHIHSFSKTHGPDLRLAAIGGSSKVIDPVIRRRHVGPSWTSRLLQHILLSLLTDDKAEALVAEARDVYAHRRQQLMDALAIQRVHPQAGTGINLWIPVESEQTAMVTLAANGIGVAPGRPFKISPTAQDHIRVTVASVSEGFDELAGLIGAAAARP